MEPSKVTSVNSRAEELFVQLFCETFGPEKTRKFAGPVPLRGHLWTAPLYRLCAGIS
jgi:hypothetical protein